MKTIKLFPLLLLILSINFVFAQTSHPFIHVDQFGYLPDGQKVAVISNPQIGFNSGMSFTPSGTMEVRDAVTDNVVLTGSASVWNSGNIHGQSGDAGWWFDFSNITQTGTYYVIDPGNGERSDDFSIGLDVYKDVLKAAGRMFFYNRCNIAKPSPFAETGWTDGQSFMNNLQDANCRNVYAPMDASLERELTGGWFDAGDYNKYVTFANGAIHDLLQAYTENPNIFGDDWNIPESGNGIPDILDEIKWELDWLMKMTNADGSVILKMGSTDFNENVEAPPSANMDQRFYSNTCSSASIAIASMFSHAAYVFEQIASQSSYASQLETKAIDCWNYALPFYNNDNFEEDCDDGAILAGNADWDAVKQTDELLVASVYLWELTGDSAYETFFANNMVNTEQIVSAFWGPYKMPLNDAMLFYSGQSGANQILATTIQSSIALDASDDNNGYWGFNADDFYRGYIPDWSYHWGSNLPKSSYALLNLQLNNYGINSTSSSDYDLMAAELLHYFHGVNPLGIVYLSNMGNLGAEYSANEIYHTWFADGTDWDNALTSLYGPPPGYVSGGANPFFSVPSISPPSGQPIMKSYLDFNDDWPNNSWEISEPAIYYQAAYLRLLAYYDRSDEVVLVLEPEEQLEHEAAQMRMHVYPNPVTDIVQISFPKNPHPMHIKLYKMEGRQVEVPIKVQEDIVELDLSELPAGIYLLTLDDPTNGGIYREKLVKSGK